MYVHQYVLKKRNKKEKEINRLKECRLPPRQHAKNKDKSEVFFCFTVFPLYTSSSASGFRVKNGLLNGHSPPRFSRVPFRFSSSTDKLPDP